MPKESSYQAKLIKKLKRLYPGIVVMKNDAGYQQGMLDLSLLFEERWACLEVKQSEKSALQPNQEYFVQKLNDMSFAAVIYPENEEEVLAALSQAFASRRCTRVSES